MRKFLITAAAALVAATVAVFAQQGGGQLPNGGGGAITGTNGNSVTINGNNELRATIEGQNLCVDTFDTGIDSTKWTTVAGNGGVIATEAPGTGGGITLASGTSANGYSYIVGKSPKCGPFATVPPGFIVYGFRIQLPTPLVANQYAFWGFTGDVIPATPTTTVPLNDGLGLELTTTGKLQFVSYQHGAGRVLIKDLSSTGSNVQPTDGATYTWYLNFRGDKFYVALTDQDNIVATGTGANGPNINTGSPIVITLGASTPPASSFVLTVPAIFVGDNGHNSFAISDGAFPAIKSTVKSGVSAALTTDNPLVFTAAPYLYSNISSATTLTVKSGAGFLHTICINTPAAGTLSLFDNTAGSGTSIGVLTEVASQIPNCSNFDVNFVTGLTLVQSAGGNATASYR